MTSKRCVHFESRSSSGSSERDKKGRGRSESGDSLVETLAARLSGVLKAELRSAFAEESLRFIEQFEHLRQLLQKDLGKDEGSRSLNVSSLKSRVRAQTAEHQEPKARHRSLLRGRQPLSRDSCDPQENPTSLSESSVSDTKSSPRTSGNSGLARKLLAAKVATCPDFVEIRLDEASECSKAGGSAPGRSSARASTCPELESPSLGGEEVGMSGFPSEDSDQRKDAFGSRQAKRTASSPAAVSTTVELFRQCMSEATCMSEAEPRPPPPEEDVRPPAREPHRLRVFRPGVPDGPEPTTDNLEALDIQSLARAFASTGSAGSAVSAVSKASKYSKVTTLTVASATTCHSAVTRRGREEMRGRGITKASCESRVQAEASCATEGSSGSGGRARMLGAEGSQKKVWAHRLRSQRNAELADLEQSLHSELFHAKELLRTPSHKPEGRHTQDEHTERLRGPRWPSERRHLKYDSEPVAPDQEPICRPGVRLPASILGAPSSDPPLLQSEQMNGGGGERDSNSESEGQIRRFFARLRNFGSERTAGAHRSNARRSAEGSPGPSKESTAQSASSSLTRGCGSGGTSSTDTTAASTPDHRSEPDMLLPAPPRASKKMSTCAVLRQQNEQQLVRSLTQESDADGDFDSGPRLSLGSGKSDKGMVCAVLQEMISKVVSAVPRACGVVPWTSRRKLASAVYQWTIILLALGSVTAFAMEAHKKLADQAGATISFCLDVVLALGSFAGLLLCGALWRSKAIHDNAKLLTSYARREGFLDQWKSLSFRDLCCTLALWFSAILLRVLSAELKQDVDASNIAAFAFVTGLHMGMTSCILHICRCMAKMVDTFCHHVVEHADFAEALREWNLVQAVCRTSCSSIQGCFIAQQATATAAALVCILEVTNGLGWEKVMVLAPTLLVSLAMIRASVWAAAVTDKCTRVPMLVNSLSVGQDLDPDRMYIVEYIVHSRAGYYIFEVRLTSATVLKALYIACAATIGAASQLL